MKFSFNMLYCIKKQYFKTQLINTEHRTQDTDTELRTQTHAKNIHQRTNLEPLPRNLQDHNLTLFQEMFQISQKILVQVFTINNIHITILETLPRNLQNHN